MRDQNRIDPDKIVAALQSVRGRSVASQLRPLLPLLDEMVKDGTSHNDILATLKEQGLKVELETFRTNLYRYRSAQRKKEGGDDA